MGMYYLLNELTTFKRRSAVKVRVIRSYAVMERRGSSEIKSKELVLHDEEGFDSDEGESLIAMLPPMKNAEASDGAVKRCLLDQFSSSKGKMFCHNSSARCCFLNHCYSFLI